MNELTLANQAANWHRLKALVLDSVSSPITRRVYNLGLDEFIAWYGKGPRPGFTKTTVNAWRMALEARGLGPIYVNVRITAVRKLAVEAADNGLLAPELAAGITRVKGAKSKGVRVGNWLSVRQVQAILNAPDVATKSSVNEIKVSMERLAEGHTTTREFQAEARRRSDDCAADRRDLWNKINDIRDRELREIRDKVDDARAEASTAMERANSVYTWLRIACVAYGALLLALFVAALHR
jgi:hypothetical protein